MWRGLQLLYYKDGSIPGIIQVAFAWFRDNLIERPKWKNLINKPARGVTRVLPSYWDDWWNHPNAIAPDPPYTWFNRFDDADYRGILHYAAQVGTQSFMCQYHNILRFDMNRLESIG
jgi:hypothetical protein